jgi:hypothetical protein
MSSIQMNSATSAPLIDEAVRYRRHVGAKL